MKWQALRRISVPKDHLAITATGDWHCGAKASRDDIITPCVERIGREPDHFGILTGDLYEAITGDDKRSDSTNTDSRAPAGQVITWQSTHAMEFAKVAAGKWLGYGIGNHERTFLLRVGMLGTYYAHAKEIGAPALEYCARFPLAVWFNDPKGLKRGPPHRVEEVCFHHGAGAAATRSGKKLALERLMNGPVGHDATLVFMAHLHGLDAIISLYKSAKPDRTGSVLRCRVGALCGCALDTYDDNSTTYGEMRAYGDFALGFPTVHMYRDDPFTRVEL
jgi:hypothetical protein